MLLADDGARDGKQIIPRDYLLEATDFKRHPPAFAPRAATPYYGYGYQFWTYPAESRRFALLGVFGQSIFVDPQLRLALIITAAQRDPVSIGDGYGAERNTLWRSIVERTAPGDGVADRSGGAARGDGTPSGNSASAILRAARGPGTVRGKTASVGAPWNRRRFGRIACWWPGS